MGNALKKMEAEALKLPARSRARLAKKLIASLEKVVDPKTESGWFAGVERRSAELAKGKVKRHTCKQGIEKGAHCARVTVIFHPLAEREQIAAAKFYETRRAYAAKAGVKNGFAGSLHRRALT